MKILYLTPTLPYPVNSGGHKRSFLMLQALAKHGDVTLMASGDPARDQVNADALKEYCRDIRIIDSKKFGPHSNDGKRVGLRERLRRLAFFEPWVIEDYFTAEFRNALVNAKSDEYDLVVIRYLHVAYSFLREEKLKAVLNRVVVDVDDILIQMEERRTRSLKFGYAKLRHMIEIFFLRHLYRKLKFVRACFVVSEKDKEYLLKRKFAKKVFIVPNAIEVNGRFKGCSNTGAAPEILFCGVLSYPHNEEGVIYFANEVFPIVKNRIPEAKLTIAGKNPTEKIFRLGTIQGVTVVGPVPSMAPYYEKASLSVVPIFNGAGTRVKILESMTYGCPVVSTTIGAEGLDVIDGDNILIADETEVFAQKCVELLKNPEMRNRIAASGFELVKNKYDVSVFNQRIDEAFRFTEEIDRAAV